MPAADAPLNLLFVFTDEQRFDTLAAYGNDRIAMPNLNRLAAESVVFDRAYVTQPVCTPSRGSLMTGLYPHTHGCTENNVPLRPETPCLAEMLPGDYACGYHGKWHLGDEIFAQHGFEDWVSIEDAYAAFYGPGRDPEARSSYHHFLLERGYTPGNGTRFGRGETAAFPEEVSKPAFLAGEACRFLRRHRDEPFCLAVNFLEPHMPFTGPRDGQYDPDAIPLPENFDALPGDDATLRARLFREAYLAQNPAFRDEKEWRALRARYWGLCSQVDTHAGRILAELESLGLAERTVVVFTSDHGDMMGSHGLLAKCVMYEEAIRVPLLLRLPGQHAARRVDGPVSQVDVVPTLLDALGVAPPPHLEGKSLLPKVEGREPPGDDVVVEWNGPNTGFGDNLDKVCLPEPAASLASPETLREAVLDPVRTLLTPEGWKFCCSPRGDHELYDLSDDPLETHNLARTPEGEARMRELAPRLRAWQARTGDTAPAGSACTH